MLPPPPGSVSTPAPLRRGSPAKERRGWVRPVIALCLLPVYGGLALVVLLFMVLAPLMSTSPIGVVVGTLVLGVPGIGLVVLAFGRLSWPLTISLSVVVAVLAFGFAVGMAFFLPPQPPALAATLDRVSVPAGLTLLRERRTEGSCLDVCPQVTRRYCIADPAGADLAAVSKAFGDAGIPLERRGDDLIPAPGADRKHHVTVDQSQTSNREECASGRVLVFEAEGRDA